MRERYVSEITWNSAGVHSFSKEISNFKPMVCDNLIINAEYMQLPIHLPKVIKEIKKNIALSGTDNFRPRNFSILFFELNEKSDNGVTIDINEPMDIDNAEAVVKYCLNDKTSKFREVTFALHVRGQQVLNLDTDKDIVLWLDQEKEDDSLILKGKMGNVKLRGTRNLVVKIQGEAKNVTHHGVDVIMDVMDYSNLPDLDEAWWNEYNGRDDTLQKLEWLSHHNKNLSKKHDYIISDLIDYLRGETEMTENEIEHALSFLKNNNRRYNREQERIIDELTISETDRSYEKLPDGFNESLVQRLNRLVGE